MENPVLITWLNDFVFCPVSIYFHNLYGTKNSVSFQDTSQINGSAAHQSIDAGKYSSRKAILSGISVYSEQYNFIGKIDLFHTDTGELIERKKKIKTVYDGYVFQLYAQCLALREMGYSVRRITLRSMDDNRRYPLPLPEDDPAMFDKFLNTLSALNTIELTSFVQTNRLKCENCIYEPICDSSLLGKGDSSC